MWNKFFPTCFLLILLTAVSNAQETIHTSFVSNSFPASSASPLVITNEKSRHWVVLWQQDATIYARIVDRNGNASAPKPLLSGIAAETSFDFIHIRKSGLYFLAYETAGSLRVQVFNQRLNRAGAPTLLRRTTGGSQLRLHYERNTNRTHLFGLLRQSQSSTALVTWQLGSNGKPVSEPATLLKKEAAEAIQSFDIAQTSRGNILIISERSNSGTAILGYRFNDGASSLNQTPLIFQRSGIAGSGPSAASGIGDALAVWKIGSQIRYRILSDQGFLAAPATLAAPGNTAEFKAWFDGKKEQFAVVWTKGNEIYAAAQDTVRISTHHEPVKIAEGAGTARDVSVSYDTASGRALIVWEDQTGALLRVRSAVVLIRGEEFPVQGRVVLRKDYNPPFFVNQYKYLSKLHIRSRGKLFRAYVTPETEVVGQLPQAGNNVRMIYEPFRSKYRGYVEAIRIIP